MFFPIVGGSTAYGRGTKFREPTGHDITPGIPPELSNLMHQVLAIERIGPLRRGFRAMHDQLTQLDRGRCKAPAPYYFYKDGKSSKKF